MAFIAGAYTVTYKGLQLGQLEDGIFIESDLRAELITGDNLGDAIQDGVYRAGNIYFTFTLLEYNAPGAQAAFWPHNPTYGRFSVPGFLLSSMYGPLVLNKVAGPNSAPNSITAPLAGLSPDFPVRILMAPRLKRVPLRMLCLPAYDGNNYYAFVQS